MMSEEVLGALHASQIIGLFTDDNIYELIFASDRILAIYGWRKHTEVGTSGSHDLFSAFLDAVSQEWTNKRAREKTAESIKRMEERERQAKTLEELFNADERNFAIPYSEITKVELKKGWIRVILNIITSKKKHKWSVHAVIPEKSPNFPLGHHRKPIEDYEIMLRPILGDKLSVKK